MKTSLLTLSVMTLATMSAGGCGGSKSNPSAKPSQMDIVRSAVANASDDCGTDADCAAAETCQEFCGNGWCGHVCLPGDAPAPDNTGCQSDADCAAQETCTVFCGNGWCAGLCVTGQCTADSDCADGAICTDGQCVTPAPAPSSCTVDTDCATNEHCQTYCGNGWCDSICVASECGQDSDCQNGDTCVSGSCVVPEPPLSECSADADCASGQHCRVYCGNGWCSGECKDTQSDLEACLYACGVGCPAPEYWTYCDASGQRYCNSCIAACYGEDVGLCTTP